MVARRLSHEIHLRQCPPGIPTEAGYDSNMLCYHRCYNGGVDLALANRHGKVLDRKCRKYLCNHVMEAFCTFSDFQIFTSGSLSSSVWEGYSCTDRKNNNKFKMGLNILKSRTAPFATGMWLLILSLYTTRVLIYNSISDFFYRMYRQPRI